MLLWGQEQYGIYLGSGLSGSPVIGRWWTVSVWFLIFHNAGLPFIGFDSLAILVLLVRCFCDENVSTDHVSRLYLHWSWMVPICGKMILLYAIQMAFDRVTNFDGKFRNICLYICSVSMFPSAPASTFTNSFADFFSSWYLNSYLVVGVYPNCLLCGIWIHHNHYCQCHFLLHEHFNVSLLIVFRLISLLW